MQDTLDITQDLRTKYELITYNRSTCEYLSEEQYLESLSVINAVQSNLSNFKQLKPNSAIKSRAFNDSNVDAHHAIIPTEVTMDLSKLSEKERAVYELIARRYIAQFYPNHQYKECKLLIKCMNHHFVAIGNQTTNLGWKELYLNIKESDDRIDDNDNEPPQSSVDLDVLDIKTVGRNTLAEQQQRETKPKPHYTEKTLLLDLTRVANYVKDPKLKAILKNRDKDKKGEHGGIGTPATRSEIIKTLINRGFIEMKKKKITSTQLGQDFYNALPDSVKYPDMTAIWHEQQEGIVKGRITMEQFLAYLEQFIAKEIQLLKTNSDYIQSFTSITVKETESESEHKCPNCGKGLKKIKGQYGLFWSCSGYPTCKSSFKNSRNKPVFGDKN